MGKNIGIFLLGLIVGMLWNIGLVMLNVFVLYPGGEGFDMNDPEIMKAHVATLPTMAFIVTLIAHVGQAVVGGFVISCLAKTHSARMIWILGIFTAVGSVWTQMSLEGPSWMWVDGPLVMLGTWMVVQMDTKRRAATN